MLKRQSNEKISHGNTKQLKCSRLQEQVHVSKLLWKKGYVFSGLTGYKPHS